MRWPATASTRSSTGSTGIGTRMTELAGVKKSVAGTRCSCPVVVLPDADIDAAAAAVASADVNAGQARISVERVITHPQHPETSCTPGGPRRKIATGNRCRRTRRWARSS